jgi:DNA repair protein RadC
MKNKVNEIKISYKEKNKNLTPIIIKKSSQAAQLLFEHWDRDTIALHESFKVVLLNNSNIVKGVYELSKGGIAGTLVDLRLLFAVALKTLSTGLILVHNHPSGSLKPSKADLDLTRKIAKAASYLDIKILDHLILSPHGDYYSFADNDIL